MNKVFKVKKNKFGSHVVTSELATNKGASIVSKLFIAGVLVAAYPLNALATEYTYIGEASNLEQLVNDNEQYGDEFQDGSLGFGSGQGGELNHNVVTINMEQGTNPPVVYGAMDYSDSSLSFSDNVVNLTKGNIVNNDDSQAYGILGYVQGDASITATDNTVNIGSDFGYVGYVMGAHVVAKGDGNNTAISNVVNVNGYQTDGNKGIKLAGVEAYTAGNGNITANNNQVNISDATFNGDAEMVTVDIGSYGTKAVNINAEGNALTINNSEFTGSYVSLLTVSLDDGSDDEENDGLVNNPLANTTIKDNTLSITNSTIKPTQFGEIAVVDAQLAANIANNHMSITDSTIDNTRITAVVAYGKSGTVSDNSLTLDNTVVTNIPDNDDGIKSISAVQSNGVGNVHFANNTLTIGDNVSIDAGTTLAAVYIEQGENNGTFENNKVVINGTSHLENVDIYGVYYKDPLARSAVNANTGSSTLEVYSYNNTVNVGSVNNFDNYDFYIAGDNVVEGPLLATDQSVSLINHDGDTANINVAVNGKATLSKGDSLNLFNNVEANEKYEDGVTIRVKQGSGAYYDATVKLNEDGSLESEITSDAKGTESSKALVEPQSAAMAFLSQGGDLVNNQNISQSGVDGEWSGFGAISGGSSRYNTGSHIKVNGYSLLVGSVAKKDDLSVGAFFEAGFGNYSTHNDSLDGNEIYGSGKTSYKGVGLIGRYDITPTIYSDLNMRIGRVKVDFDSSDLAVDGVNANYDNHSTYFSTSAGLGKLLQVTDNSILDLQTRYTYTYLQGKDINTAQDTYDFANTHSNRVQLDGIYTVKVNNWVSPYIGLGYQYEFSGKSKGVISGMESDRTSLQGSTGTMQIGFKGDHENLSYQIGANGYVGKREGVTGSVSLAYRF